MRLAWFSPLSPRISGLATYSAAIVAALAPDADIDVFVDDGDPADLAPRLGGSVAVRPAHDFVWMQARRPYDLTVYQLANAASHAYLWGYAVRYPGLAVLHDQVLHHARGAHLRRAHRRRDYRAEVGYDRPDLEASIPAVADLAVPHLLANWPLVRPILATARRCVVHDSAAADDLRGRYPEGRVDVVRYGVTPPAGGRLRRADSAPVVFAALPHTACVRRLREILRALARVRRETPATLRVLGPCEDDVDLAGEIRAAGLDAGAVAGPEASWGGSDGGEALACDVYLCLGSLAVHEITDTWLRCLAAGRATVVSARARLAGMPLLDARTWRDLHGGREAGVAVAVDPRHESESLWLAMRRLAMDGVFREGLRERARSWWAAQRATEAGMIDDYWRVIREAAGVAPGSGDGLPRHFRSDGLEIAEAIAEECGVKHGPFDLDPPEVH